MIPLFGKNRKKWPNKETYNMLSHFYEAWMLYGKTYKNSWARRHEKASTLAKFYDLTKVDGMVSCAEHSWVIYKEHWILDPGAYHIGMLHCTEIILRSSPIGYLYNPAQLPYTCRPKPYVVDRLLKCMEETHEP